MNVMKQKWVVVKGAYGMGGRINVMLGALNYANQNGRKLVVDWSDGFYGTELNTFHSLFKSDTTKFSEFLDDIEGQELNCLPDIWQNNYQIPGRQKTDQNLYITTHPKSSVDEDVVVVTWVSNTIDPVDLKHLAKKLEPIDEIKKTVEDTWNSCNGYQIGVHYRHGNGEYGVICPEPDWFLTKINEIDPSGMHKILLCTDSKEAETFFRNSWGPRVIVHEKEFPKIGALHNNSSVKDRRKNAIDSIVDLYLLARSEYLVDSGNFFGITTRLLGAGEKSGSYTYPHPTRVYDTPEIKEMCKELVPLRQIPSLLKSFGSSGIRTDQLFVKMRNDEHFQLFYGWLDQGIYPLESSESDLGKIKSLLKARRLY